MCVCMCGYIHVHVYQSISWLWGVTTGGTQGLGVILSMLGGTNVLYAKHALQCSKSIFKCFSSILRRLLFSKYVNIYELFNKGKEFFPAKYTQGKK